MADPNNTPAPSYRVDPTVHIEIDVSWRDVDALTNATDLIHGGDILATVVAAQVRDAIKSPVSPSSETIRVLRSLVERIVGKLPPRGAVVDAAPRSPQSSAP